MKAWRFQLRNGLKASVTELKPEGAAKINGSFKSEKGVPLIVNRTGYLVVRVLVGAEYVDLVYFNWMRPRSKFPLWLKQRLSMELTRTVDEALSILYHGAAYYPEGRVGTLLKKSVVTGVPPSVAAVVN